MKKKADLRENDEHSPPLKKRKPVTKTTGKQDDLLLDDDTPMEGVVHLRSPDAFKDTQETNGRRKLRTLAADKKAVSRKLQPLEPDFSKKQIKKKRKDPFWFISKICLSSLLIVNRKNSTNAKQSRICIFKYCTG